MCNVFVVHTNKIARLRNITDYSSWDIINNCWKLTACLWVFSKRGFSRECKRSSLPPSRVGAYISICHLVCPTCAHPKCNQVDHMFYILGEVTDILWGADMYQVAKSLSFMSTCWFTWILWGIRVTLSAKTILVSSGVNHILWVMFYDIL